MNSSQLESMLTSEIALRNWVNQNLPIENSLAAFDLLLIIGLNYYSGSPKQTVKQLFSSLPSYSYIGVRTHYLRFIELGLLELSADAIDKRVKHITPSQKMLDLLLKYLEQKLL